MPNIKSAEKRVRSTARKFEFNRAAKSRASTLERQFNRLVREGKKEEAGALLPRVTAAYDKAAKRGACHRNKADHKKSRLTRAYNSIS
ncbi:MAG: 30S ribosomal protein S20 [Verrucomicrobia subdivision 3 bacterium]|nr:30S ribosomal protein S20 [Limisphaerales bacterium]MCS1416398.1 30S ribosomal protein S20 [Limisphaerales bacterium]